MFRRYLYRPFVNAGLDFVHLLLLTPLPVVQRFKQGLLCRWMDYIHPDSRHSRLSLLVFKVVFNNFIKREYLAERNPDKREQMKELAMGGESGVKWAQMYLNRGIDVSADLFGEDDLASSPVLQAVLEDYDENKPKIIIQLGCSSGREIGYLARKFPDTLCLGTDVYPAIVEFCKSYYSVPNLEFQLSAAHKIGYQLSPNQGGTVIIFASGSLQYVQPEHIKDMYETLARSDISRVNFYVGEPVNEGGLNEARKSEPPSQWRGSFSFSHDYKKYSERAGFVTKEFKLLRPEEDYKKNNPKAANTLHYLLVSSVEQESNSADGSRN